MTDDKGWPSTGLTALQAFKDDPDITRLVVTIRKRYPSEALELIQQAIESTLSTSTMTVEYGPDRPSGLEFFKLKLTELALGRIESE